MRAGFHQRSALKWTLFQSADHVDLWDRHRPVLEGDVSLTGNRFVVVYEKLREQDQLPLQLHMDNGPEFNCKALDAWDHEHGAA